MSLENKIKELLIPYLDGERIYIVDLKVSASRINTKVIILIDTDAGITIDDCAEISRKLGHDLEEQNIIPNAYNLEVSSPGIDTPLKFIRQYQKNIGRTLKVVMKDKTEKLGKLEAIVTDEAGNQLITLIKETTKKPKKGEVIEPMIIPFEEIKEAIVQISFK